MTARLFGTKTLGSVLAAAIVASLPMAAQADGYYAEMREQRPAIKRHKVRHRAARTITNTVTERIVEKPVIIEKVVEKQVFVDKPTIVEKEVVIEKPMEMDRKIVVEHPRHKKHLIHIGIPFIGLDLF